MCGIVAYTGEKEASDIIIKGLKRLEYRGYDSAGIALLNGGLNTYKCKGKVIDLEDKLKNQELHSHTGIGHTRWATHGEPNDTNAHPHYSDDNSIAIVHNGIIENYTTLKKKLQADGHRFLSDTDSEVLVHLIENIRNHQQCALETAVRLALDQVVGAYAIVVIDKNKPKELIAARKSSPLVLGIGEDKGEFFLASDATPIVEYTNKVVYLDDYEIATIKNGELKITNIENDSKTPYIEELELTLESIEKGGFDHFMLKEIFEQPTALENCLRGRLVSQQALLQLGGIASYKNTLANAKRIIILGCGTSWHAGLVAEYIFEEFARIPVEVEYASEFRYRNPVINEGDIVIPVSQSGETADTLAAIELAKSKGAIILAVCNVVGSSIARTAHAGVYTHAGPEIGVASTKAFTTQVSVLSMIALMVAHQKGTINEDTYRSLLVDMELLPKHLQSIITQNQSIQKIATLFKDAANFLYLGRGYNFPVALEGALKLKEISYIHAEGYPAAEMKHGPIALIDEEMPVVVIATKDKSYEKIVSNIQEVKARKGKVIAIVTQGEQLIPDMADFVIEIPHVHEALTPVLAVTPLQLLSYHIAVMRGCNVDQPRNLAKSVTVE